MLVVWHNACKEIQAAHRLVEWLFIATLGHLARQDVVSEHHPPCMLRQMADNGRSAEAEGPARTAKYDSRCTCCSGKQ